MSIEAGLYAYLTADAGVSAVIGNRLYPLAIPQGATLPAAAYQRISYRNLLAHDGVTNYATVRVQITCTADTYDSAKSASEAIRQACDGYSGVMGAYTVHECEIVTMLDGYNQDTDRHTVRLDVMIHFAEV